MKNSPWFERHCQRVRGVFLGLTLFSKKKKRRQEVKDLFFRGFWGVGKLNEIKRFFLKGWIFH